MSAPRIFLCHASEDKSAVSQVHTNLTKLGFQPWLDKVDLLPGQRWDIEIPKALRSSDFAIIFLSQHSVSKRGYVQKEFKLCLDVLDEIPEGQVFVIPAKLDDCQVPDRFVRLQWVNLHEDGSLEKIAETIRRYSSGTAAIRSALASAEEPLESAIQNAKDGIKQLEGRLLAVPDQYRANYELLLREPNTGLIRLLPRGRYDQAMLLRGAGAYYSFSRMTHEYGYGSDIELQQGKLCVGFAGLDFGFFLVLGDVPLFHLLNVGSSAPDWLPKDWHAAWQHMWSYRPPEQRRDLRLEHLAYRAGVPKGSTTLVDKAEATPRRTYLLRSINLLNSDNLVAVRVEAFLADGSVVLAWIKLREFPATKPKGPDLYKGD